MKLHEVVQWQWQGYGRNHRDRLNLLIHFVAVPLFIAGCLAIGLSILWQAGTVAVAGLVSIVLSLALEGIGHKREQEAPAPFAGPVDFVRRYFVEQWITFPRFVLSGGWWRNLSGQTD